jgi:hypothetical protein
VVVCVTMVMIVAMIVPMIMSVSMAVIVSMVVLVVVRVSATAYRAHHSTSNSLTRRSSPAVTCNW